MSAPESTRATGMRKVLPVVYFLLAIGLMVALHFALPLARIIPSPWRLLGFGPLIAGISLAVAADLAFKRHRTSVIPFKKPSALITDGAFSLSRNPIYLGMVMALAGIAVLLGSLTPWIMVPALPVFLDRVFVAPEERMLDAAFGDSFREYRRRVRRWL